MERINKTTSRLHRQKKPASPIGPIVAIVVGAIIVAMIVRSGDHGKHKKTAKVSNDAIVEKTYIEKKHTQTPVVTVIKPECKTPKTKNEKAVKTEKRKDNQAIKAFEQENKEKQENEKKQVELMREYNSITNSAKVALKSYDFDLALKKYCNFEKLHKDISETLAVDIDFQKRSTKGLRDLFGKLIKTVKQKKITGKVKVANFDNVTLVDADHEFLTVLIQDKARARLRWENIPAKDMIALYKRMRLNKKYMLCLGIFCYLHGFDREGDMELNVLSKKSPAMKKLIFQAVAMDRGISPVPEEFIFLNARWYTQKEYAAVIEEKKVENGVYEENWPNGKKRIVAHCKDGKYNGKYIEYYDNGKLNIKANYQNGELHGDYEKNGENGVRLILCKYESGKLHGPYKEYYENGKQKINANYKNGELHGNYTEYNNGKVIKNQLYLNGKEMFTRSKDETRKEIARLENEAAKCKSVVYDEEPSTSPYRAGKLSLQYQQSALAYLSIYRYLSGSPYMDTVVDDYFCSKAQHASILYAVNGSIKKTEKPDDMPLGFYDIAFAGSQSCNDYHGKDSHFRHVIDNFMKDADHPEAMGHRRWCLDPDRKKFGYGVFGRFAALCIVDRERKRRSTNYDYIAFPGNGYMSIRYFGNDYEWTVILNRDKYEEPSKNSVKIKVCEFAPDFTQKPPLQLDHFAINNEHVAHSFCIIFRPKRVNVKDGARYMIEISGLKTSFRKDTAIKYIVEFIK